MRRQSTNSIIVPCNDSTAYCLNPTNGVQTMSSFSTPSPRIDASQTSSSEFVTCGAEGKLSVGSMTSGIVLKTMVGHGGEDVDCVATTSSVPDRVATGGQDCTISLWDVTAGNSVSQLQGHVGSILQLCHHPIVLPNSLFSGSEDETVREWDLTQETSLRVFNGHSDIVYGLCLDSKHQILFSGSLDKTVKGWDLRSGNEVCSFDFPNWITTLLFREESNENQLIVPVYAEKNYIYDLRSIQQNGSLNELISWSHGHDGVFGSCDVPDQNLFVTAGFGNKQVKAWRDDGSSVWEWTAPSEIYRIVAFVNDYELFVSPYLDDDDARNDRILSLEVVKKFDNLSDFHLRCDSSSPPYELPIPRAILSSSPYLKTTTSDSLSLDRSYSLIDDEGFFSVLFGVNPSPESLSQYYSLFRELRMFGFALAMCELIRMTVTEDHLEQLVSDCEFHQEDESNENEVFSSLTPFELELLRHIQEMKNDLPNRLLLRLNRCNGIVAIAALVEGMPSFRDHVDFRHLSPKDKTKTVAEAARRNLNYLLNSRNQTNVTLTTADGGEERCHLEVLITRSKFIRGMMHFEGKEYHSYLETKTIGIEDMSHAALQAWLVLCYGAEFHETDQLSIYDLLSLLIKSHMHQEDWCQRIVALLRKEINKKAVTEIPSLLLEIGPQLLSLPKLYQDRIIGFVRGKSPLDGMLHIQFDGFVELSLKFAQRMRDKVFEKEIVRDDEMAALLESEDD